MQHEDPEDLRLWIADTEAGFYSAVESALHRALVEMESGRKQYMNFSETALSKILCGLLKFARIPTTAEEDSSGHVDVTVKHRKGIFVMLGECKKYDGFVYHCGGCTQLLRRYTSGRAARTFCLEFFSVPAMYDRMRDLKGDFDRDLPLDQHGVSRDHDDIKGAFVTAHKHSSAATVEVLHVGCNLHYAESAGAQRSVAAATSSTRKSAKGRRAR
jgi:hypothetical protein